ncbi:MAG: 3-deoxy-7-phosphoheptulonate synthase [Oscillospiraceae bacterium]|nr:3-deoxy-7-phosphoheptulonate synthase [Oscillospiraceae bacterium]MBR6695472.1 3-deoxy-7-phosphoheptulonate synthase [Oscillospiraceae bacterium]
MVLILKNNPEVKKVDELLEKIAEMGLKTQVVGGASHTIVGLIGDTSHLIPEDFLHYEIVDTVQRISESYKAANRKMHPDDTIIDIGGRKIGGGTFSVIAGPCSVESEEQMKEVATDVKASGASLLRGGAFKPRTSPYAFQGLHGEGIRLLLEAKKATGLPIVTEIMDINTLDLFADVDVIQVGARNMQNFELLKALGHSDKPIFLKRGLANTIDELLMSAEYIMSGGNNNIVLCERGIRTFETKTRNTLDISAVPILKKLTHLPVFIDPSHAAGISWMVEPLSKAAIAIGADGLMIEVHNNPKKALCDGAQSLNPEQFDTLMKDIRRRVEFEGKTLA